MAPDALDAPMRRSSRRRFLVGVGGGLSALSGCVWSRGSVDDGNPDDEGGEDTDTNDDQRDPGDDEPVDRHAAVAEEVKDAVVFLPGPTSHGGAGAGFVVDETHVVTAYHLVADVDQVDVRFRDESTLAGTVAGSDPQSDLALLAVPDLPDDTATLSFAPEGIGQGRSVVAVRHPVDRHASTTRTTVEAADGLARAPTGLAVPMSVHTKPTLAPGITGGPVVTLDGEVAGVLSAGAADGTGFAVGAPLARRVVEALLGSGSYDHASLGATLAPVPDDLADRAGALVTAVVAGDAADEAGLRPAASEPVSDPAAFEYAGDVIVAIDGHAVASPADLRAHLSTVVAPGAAVDLAFVRNGRVRTVTVTPTVRPAHPIAASPAGFVDATLVRHADGYTPAHPPVAGFDHAWSFEGAAPLADLMGGADLTAAGGRVTTGTSGIFGEDALTVDAPGFVSSGGAIDVDTGGHFSMGAWLNHAETGDYGAALLLQHGPTGEALGIGVNGGRDVDRPHPKVLTVDRSNGWGPTAYDYGEWHHHVLRYDANAGTAQLWFDGTFEYEVEVRNADAWVGQLGDGQVVAGYRPVASKDYPYRGRIAWPWIATGLIDPDDIGVLYAAGRDG